MNELFEDIVKPYTLTTVLKNANPNDSMRAVLVNIVAESLQTLLDGDLLTLKKQINALISMIEVNTNAVHANTIATDNLTLAIMANPHGLLSSS
jgi:hypothetical protein